MIYALLTVIAGIVGWLISFLPPGYGMPSGASDLLIQGMAFVRSMDLLIDVDVEVTVLTSIIVWEISKAVFHAVVWAYDKIRGSG